MATSSDSEFPALLGGTPVCEGGNSDWPICDESLQLRFRELIETGAWGRYHAEYVTELEERLRTLYQLTNVQLVSSGTVAMELALRGLKIAPGDRVLMSAYDFKANFVNVVQLGAIPVLIDIRDADGQLDVEKIAAAATDNTKAIIVSHLHGGLVDLSRVTSVAEDLGIAVIEDCCQLSSCARDGNSVVGSQADVSILSFGGSKLLTSGRGGAVLTHRDDIAQRIKTYCQRGNLAYPLSEMQAAVLVPQYESLPQRHCQRQECVDAIRRELMDSHLLRPFSCRENSIADYYKLGFWYETQQFEGMTRERFCEAMKAEGIPINVGFPALHRIHSKRRFECVEELTVADRAHEQIVVLHHPFLLGGEPAARQFFLALDKLTRHARILTQP
ncbi:L-glutamine:2-deoxy-scyllo-inosose aminotransferase [Thalassoglobus neptunius]|uniref:L-glutamine:2-deoxy-scyllo-inosose aminotransferase n=1 Tax=Thalassoglobus neptunius TaxID=1938619 RepID=A0A5C5X7N9_9PLAN|nr:aminotransferase class V-fold PLP-dependent enzyme [Thalassoglobus neptunius]TWT58361.1 L-glutamine:2-deoxy-scyllo-inosose aminotransferase [Thalassoglobus neptunius]